MDINISNNIDKDKFSLNYLVVNEVYIKKKGVY